MNIEVEKALGAISTGVSRLEGLYTKLAQKQGISYGVVQVLYILKLNGAVTQKQMSEICEIPKQTVNSVIKQLKADNYITLISSSEDKREKKVRLTESGEDYTLEVLNPYFKLNEKVCERFGIDLIQRLGKELNSLGNTLEMEMELSEVTKKWNDKESNG